MPGPDFPTAGIINGAQEIATAYRTGRGRLSVRARAQHRGHRQGDRQAIIVTELPYQVNKARLHRAHRRAGAREEASTASPASCATSPTRTACASSSSSSAARSPRSCSTTCTRRRRWRRCSASTWWRCRTASRSCCRSRRCWRPSSATAARWSRGARIFDLRKARERAHVLEGLAVALANIDEVIALIKAAASPAEARAALHGAAVAAGRGHRAAGARRRHLHAPGGPGGRVRPGRRQLPAVRSAGAGDPRHAPAPPHRAWSRTRSSREYKELLEQHPRPVATSWRGPSASPRWCATSCIEVREQLRRRAPHRDQPRSSRPHHRGPDRAAGRGGDAVARRLCQVRSRSPSTRPSAAAAAARRPPRSRTRTSSRSCSSPTRTTRVLCFSNRGKVYWLKVYELPQAGRGARGKPMVNLLPLEEGEKINAVLPVKQYDEQHFVFMATSARHGQEDAAGGVLAAAHQRHHRRGSARQRPAGGRGDHRRRARDHAVSTRRQGDPLPRGAKCGPWAARPPACAASSSATARSSSRSSWSARATCSRASDRRLRQAHPARGLPAARPRRPGRHRAADLRPQRRDRWRRCRCRPARRSC